MSKSLIKLFVTVAVLAVLCIAFVRLSAQEANPVLSPDEKVAILKAQGERKDVQLQMSQLENQYRQLSLLLAEKQKAEGDAIKKAFDDHKLKVGEWQLDSELKLTKIPKAETKK